MSAISKRVVDSAVSDALADIGRMNSSSMAAGATETAASEDPRDVSQPRAESSLDEAGIAESSDAPAVLQDSMTI